MPKTLKDRRWLIKWRWQHQSLQTENVSVYIIINFVRCQITRGVVFVLVEEVTSLICFTCTLDWGYIFMFLLPTCT